MCASSETELPVPGLTFIIKVIPINHVVVNCSSGSKGSNNISALTRACMMTGITPQGVIRQGVITPDPFILIIFFLTRVNTFSVSVCVIK